MVVPPIHHACLVFGTMPTAEHSKSTTLRNDHGVPGLPHRRMTASNPK
ncbi:hypothetical protein ACEWPM_016925 [Roseovarius sp. S4756]